MYALIRKTRSILGFEGLCRVDTLGLCHDTLGFEGLCHVDTLDLEMVIFIAPTLERETPHTLDAF